MKPKKNSSTSLQSFENIGEIANSGEFRVIQTSYCLPAATEGLHWREFSVKAGLQVYKASLIKWKKIFWAPPRPPFMNSLFFWNGWSYKLKFESFGTLKNDQIAHLVPSSFLFLKRWLPLCKILLKSQVCKCYASFKEHLRSLFNST